MLSEYVIYVLVLCVCVCDSVHVFTQQEIGLFWEVSELVKVPTVLSSFSIPQGCILDEFGCPLLTMVDFFCVIPSTSVCTAVCTTVSVVHKCTTTCFEKTASAVVEGCDSSINSLVLVHDWTNTVYCM